MGKGRVSCVSPTPSAWRQWRSDSYIDSDSDSDSDSDGDSDGGGDSDSDDDDERDGGCLLASI